MVICVLVKNTLVQKLAAHGPLPEDYSCLLGEQEGGKPVGTMHSKLCSYVELGRGRKNAGGLGSVVECWAELQVSDR